MKRRALITGVTGQDGSYLAEFLLQKGYRVAGLVRRSSSVKAWRIEHLQRQIKIYPGNVLDLPSLLDAIRHFRPDEVYNLAAMSYVPASFKQPVLTTQVNSVGALHVLEALRTTHPGARFYQASSSEMFGQVRETPQRETTPFYPRSPYGASKAFAHDITVNYRETHNLFAVSGILFNHESPRRGLEFLPRKVSHGVAQIKLGRLRTLRLGNLNAKRDWGFAGDYVRAMWLMLQQDEPEDFVIATGENHTVRELVQTAFSHVGLNWRNHVVEDPSLHRPAEVATLLGDARKARRTLGWKPTVNFRDLIGMMVDEDLKIVEREIALKGLSRR